MDIFLFFGIVVDKKDCCKKILKLVFFHTLVKLELKALGPILDYF